MRNLVVRGQPSLVSLLRLETFDEVKQPLCSALYKETVADRVGVGVSLASERKQTLRCTRALAVVDSIEAALVAKVTATVPHTCHSQHS